MEIHCRWNQGYRYSVGQTGSKVTRKAPIELWVQDTIVMDPSPRLPRFLPCPSGGSSLTFVDTNSHCRLNRLIRTGSWLPSRGRVLQSSSNRAGPSSSQAISRDGLTDYYA